MLGEKEQAKPTQHGQPGFKTIKKISAYFGFSKAGEWAHIIISWQQSFYKMLHNFYVTWFCIYCNKIIQYKLPDRFLHKLWY